ncbi:MAG: hypothetical protein DCC55_03180 [Chloroflexi bacterium]|nr:MAG: hypothetical protein DCC55_03180 [Chloroflexota bacterium]
MQRHPDLNQSLRDPSTRAALLEWLASDAARDPAQSGTVANTLEFLRIGATPTEAMTIRPFLLHPDPFVRLRAYEFLLTLYFPDKNREAMLLLFHNMLTDRDEAVRSLAVSYIERANAVAELRGVLETWLQTARQQGWENTETLELVERLLAA